MNEAEEQNKEAAAQKLAADLTPPLFLQRLPAEEGSGPAAAPAEGHDAVLDTAPPTIEDYINLINNLRTKRAALIEKHTAAIAEMDDMIKELKKKLEHMVRKL